MAFEQNTAAVPPCGAQEPTVFAHFESDEASLDLSQAAASRRTLRWWRGTGWRCTPIHRFVMTW
ncbi:MAG: hypothetical protein WCA15_12070 [Candidatus Acidiferrales bacterium]